MSRDRCTPENAQLDTHNHAESQVNLSESGALLTTSLGAQPSTPFDAPPSTPGDSFGGLLPADVERRDVLVALADGSERTVEVFQAGGRFWSSSGTGDAWALWEGHLVALVCDDRGWPARTMRGGFTLAPETRAHVAGAGWTTIAGEPVPSLARVVAQLGGQVEAERWWRANEARAREERDVGVDRLAAGDGTGKEVTAERARALLALWCARADARLEEAEGVEWDLLRTVIALWERAEAAEREAARLRHIVEGPAGSMTVETMADLRMTIRAMDEGVAELRAERKALREDLVRRDARAVAAHVARLAALPVDWSVERGNPAPLPSADALEAMRAALCELAALGVDIESDRVEVDADVIGGTAIHLYAEGAERYVWLSFLNGGWKGAVLRDGDRSQGVSANGGWIAECVAFVRGDTSPPPPSRADLRARTERLDAALSAAQAAERAAAVAEIDRLPPAPDAPDADAMRAALSAVLDAPTWTQDEHRPDAVGSWSLKSIGARARGGSITAFVPGESDEHPMLFAEAEDGYMGAWANFSAEPPATLDGVLRAALRWLAEHDVFLGVRTVDEARAAVARAREGASE